MDLALSRFILRFVAPCTALNSEIHPTMVRLILLRTRLFSCSGLRFCSTTYRPKDVQDRRVGENKGWQR